MCNVVLDVHVKQYDMHMWSSTTCTIIDHYNGVPNFWVESMKIK
nr:MAG TPA: hypothetical protein [Caudoviricetes sp.]